jgi:DNA-binding GntR family transcriptional regulator
MINTELAQLRRDRLVDGVYESLRQVILNGAMRPGERLKPDSLSEKFGVSLTPVRQAIQQLANEGLVEIRPRSGTFVAQLSALDIEETFEIRCALECLAAEKAVKNISRQNLRRLGHLLKSLGKPLKDGADRTAHEEYNSELHRIIIQASGNKRLAEMYNALNAHIKIARVHSSREDWLSRLDEEQEEHEQIVANLERGDAAAVKQALTKHISRAKEVLVAGILKSAT